MAAKKQDNAFQIFVKKRLQEAGFILVSAFCVCVFLALLTYDPSDPGWSKVVKSPEISNAVGPLGAYFSDLLFYFFGITAYFIPLVLVVLAFRSLIWRKNKTEFSWFFVSFRTLGLFLAFIGASALTSLSSKEFGSLEIPSGGIFGTLASESLKQQINVVGASLIFLGLTLAGLTVAFGISWFKTFDNVGRHCFYSLVFFKKTLLSAARLTWNRLKSIQLPEKKIKPIVPVLNMTTKPMSPRQQAMTRGKVVKKVIASPKRVVSGALPDVSLLKEVTFSSKTQAISEEELDQLSGEVEKRLSEFNISVKVVAVYPGPVITRFEIALAPGIKASKITGLSKDLARSLSVFSVRVVEVIPGKAVVGLEIPNATREVVQLRELLDSKVYQNAESPITLALGKDIAGSPVIANLAKMPHLLVAGTTGSGKSVGINVMLMSLLYKATPEEVRLILIDPKMLELSIYQGIPHLLAPVVTDMKESANALRWCVGEMERRYQLMAAVGVRNIISFNQKIDEAKQAKEPMLDPFWKPEMEGEPEALERFPYIVVVIDELADLMMVSGKRVEEFIARLAQKARASGIHLILATQRPSVDVITGLIKANVPTRIAFQVSSRIDSRTILDQAGAETLLGYGDMLYLPPGTGIPTRVHGAFVEDEELHRVVKHLKSTGKPNYVSDLCRLGDLFSNHAQGEEEDAEQDELYDQAVQIVIESRKASISHLQRRLKIGYNRSARLIEAMEAAGVVSATLKNGTREVVAPKTME